MDEIVQRAMQRWPNVPNVFGWLRLDARGNWLVKSRQAQAGVPVFERIGNAAVTEFIGRNYAGDDAGRWYFQNGPQRVFVRLDYTPFVFRVEGDAIVAHTGAAAGSLRAAWLDDAGALLLEADCGPGVLLDRDLAAVAEGFVDRGGHPLEDALFDAAAAGDAVLALAGVRVPLGKIAAGAVARRFGFDPDPRPAPGEPDC
jgi:hypothetical protein